MYQYKKEPFGNFEKYTFWDDVTGNAFAIAPAQGACLLSATFEGINVIDGYNTPEELAAFGWSKSAILYPFPNRLKDGKYIHNDIEYTFDINNADTSNAIHGFGRKLDHKVVDIKLTPASAKITCAYIHDGNNASYPFKFLFSITFKLSNKGLKIKMSFTSLEESGAIPVGLGWHPYFRLNEDVSQLSLQLPDCQLIKIDDRMLPTGEKTTYDTFNKLGKLNDIRLDNGFYIPQRSGKAIVKVVSDKGVLSYWQNLNTYQFLQVFTPPYGTSIALEPMTCNIDAFNNKDGLILLEKDETLSGSFGFSFTPKL